MTVIKNSKKMAVKFWDKVEREQVDNFLRESMARKFVLKGVGDKKQITKVLKNGRNWKKNCPFQGPDMQLRGILYV